MTEARYVKIEKGSKKLILKMRRGDHFSSLKASKASVEIVDWAGDLSAFVQNGIIFGETEYGHIDSILLDQASSEEELESFAIEILLKQALLAKATNEEAFLLGAKSTPTRRALLRHFLK